MLQIFVCKCDAYVGIPILSALQSVICICGMDLSPCFLTPTHIASILLDFPLPYFQKLSANWNQKERNSFGILGWECNPPWNLVLRWNSWKVPIRCTDKKENKIFLLYMYIRKSRGDRLQSPIWLTVSSYMTKYLRIFSYMRKLFLIYDFATALSSEFPLFEKPTFH